MKKPKLRTVEKYKPPFTLNEFPKDFHITLGREVIYLLASRITPRLEGSDWEEIFTRLIGGRWKPTNVGLDDVLLEQTAWSAKTVKYSTPSKAKKVRLISGRNSLSYSYDVDEILRSDPNKVGEMVLNIWNERVSSIRAKYQHLRTVVLVKSDDLLELAVFEIDTDIYPTNSYTWTWNKNKNLVGHHKQSQYHRFTWQPSGSQFTIVKDVPKKRLALRLRQPESLNRDAVLKTLKFDDSWVEIIE